ncbi:MAG: RNA polymerase sigma factor [Pseudomonadota bacterium]|nr:RNA polymerase sigma factor [Pseudomonadota bacterium]
MSRPSIATARNYESLAEDELVALAQRGERGAFAGIMQRYNQRLFRVARSVVRDDHEAEDVLQEAYTRAFANFAGFRGESALATWLTTITLNEARGRLRRRRNNVGLEAVEAAQQESGRVIMFPSPFGNTSPEADAARTEARRLLERAVDDLPEGFRAVFIMRGVDELSVEETAQALGLKPETVKTRLHRARRLLRESLDAKLGSAVKEAFPFMGARCNRITERVLGRLAPVYGWDADPAA